MAEEAVQLRGEGRGARREEPHAPAEHGLHLLEEDGIEDELGPLGLHAPPEEELRDAALRVDALRHLVVDARVDAGDAGHDRRPEGGEVVGDHLGGRALVEANRATHDDAVHLHAGLEGVGEGEVGDVHVVLAEELDVLVLEEQRRRRGQDVLVGQDDALGVAGGAGGVHDVRPVLGLREQLRSRGVVRAVLDQLLEREERQPSVLDRLALGLRGVGLHQDDELEHRRLALDEGRELGALAAHGRELRVFDDIRARLRAQGVVHGGHGNALREGGQQGLGPLGAVDRVDAEAGLRDAGGRVGGVQLDEALEALADVGDVGGDLLEGLPEVISALPVCEVCAMAEEVAVTELGGGALEAHGAGVDLGLVNVGDADQFIVTGGAARPGLARRGSRAVLNGQRHG
mmetsp:Transcript_33066/g.78306  ORF Transcript_33066/g.78306 Transcript_33066/m.78306 type:complete len:402 (-) Transcript_33066:21-1226(-)